METLRFGVIGLGNMGMVHLRNCLSLEHAKVEAVSDVSKKALNIARNMGVKKAFSDYRQLVNDPSVEAVIIALPTHLHASCAEEAAEAGKDVFLEKPLAKNVAEGKRIISAARRTGTKLMIGYPFRFSSSFRTLKRMIQRGELGEIQIGYATHIGPGPFLHRAKGDAPLRVPSWWFKKELTGGGALMDVGIHMINLVRWYFGEISDVTSYTGYRYNLDFEDYAICIIKFWSGQIAIVNAGWFSQKYEIRVDLHGTFGHASATQNPPSTIRTATQLLIGRPFDFYRHYLKELAYFVQCVRYDRTPLNTGEDALKDLEAISLAYNNKIALP